jgi:hypothetical protein
MRKRVRVLQEEGTMMTTTTRLRTTVATLNTISRSLSFDSIPATRHPYSSCTMLTLFSGGPDPSLGTVQWLARWCASLTYCKVSTMLDHSSKFDPNYVVITTVPKSALSILYLKGLGIITCHSGCTFQTRLSCKT